MSQFVLAIDAGTTSVRAVLVDHQSQFVGIAQKETPHTFPNPGWVEQDPMDIWRSIQSVMAEVLIQTGILPDQIATIGITNQRETTIIWDKHTGEPIYPAIVWQSRQSVHICDQIKASGDDSLIHQKTGLPVDPYFSATKIRWILDHVPGAQARAEAGSLLFGTVDTWLLWKLTDGVTHATDYTNASRTMLLNLETLDYDEELLTYFNIPRAMLPEIRDTNAHFGTTAPHHLSGYSVPITGIVGDQQAALIGQFAFDDGSVKCTYGTGAFIVMNTGSERILSQHQLITTIAYKFGDDCAYALEGSVFVAGSAIQWLRDGLELLQHSADSEVMAEQADPHNPVYVIPAFTGLGAPYWDANARGAIFGLTQSTSRRELVQATLDSLAYQVFDVIQMMELETGLDLPYLKVDGGAARNHYLLQRQADLLAKPVDRVANLETTALGAAYVAGLAIGYWPDWQTIQDQSAPLHRFEPKMSERERQQRLQGWQAAVEATRLFAVRTQGSE